LAELIFRLVSPAPLNMAATSNRKYLFRSPLKLSQLPTHPAIPLPSTGASKSTPPELEPFLLDILTEGTRLADDGLASFKSHGMKPSSPSSTKVELLSTDLPGKSNGPAETWFARRSRHVNKASPGTASYDELVGALLQNHSENEKAYTPDVVDAHEVASWNNLIQKDLHGEVGGDRNGDTDGSPHSNRAPYTNVGMRVLEMVHHIPPPLNNRVFCVVVVTGKTRDAGFIIVQVPIDLAAFPAQSVRYANGRNRKGKGGPSAGVGSDGDEGDRDDETSKKTTTGTYVSVERCRRVKKGTFEKGDDETLWDMTTASDAGGYLPMWAQKMGVPGMLVKDVGLVVDWLGKKRQKY
jgi:hypothetical protein